MTQTDQPLQHIAGCDGTEEYGPCAACRWFRELVYEQHAWARWLSLFRYTILTRWDGWGCG